MARVEPGMMIKLRSGLHCLNTRDNAIEITRDLLTVVVENVRVSPIGSEDDHFDECFMVDVRQLNQDLSYDPGAPILTFAQEGDFRPEFIDGAPEVIRRMQRTYV